jgi:6-hydroxycyclohex-1-ene-1-carbonyl-CoA dehydrogenase
MKAAVLYAGEKKLKVEEVPLPTPRAGEALIRVAACGVCHTDLHYLDHGVPTFKEPPVILGHEISGTVEEVGEGVESLEAGDRVIIPAVLTCHRCRACLSGRANLCEQMLMVGNHIDGGYAEFIRVPAEDLIRVPDDLPLQDCSVIADALSTPFHAVVNRAKVRPGEVAVVFGCGGVGINVVQFAALAGAYVIAVDLMEAKLDLALQLGASEVFLAGKDDVARQIRKKTGGCDVAFEVIGKPEVMLQAMSTLRPGGRFVMVGYSAENLPVPASRIMFRELEIIGSLGCAPVDYPKIVQMVRAGHVRLEPVITRRYPLEQINEAFDALRKNEPILRSLVVF